MGEPFGDDTSPCDKGDSLTWLEELFVIEKYLEETPLEESRVDDMIVGVPPSPDLMNLILVEAFDIVSIPSPFFLTTPSHMHVLDASSMIFWGVISPLTFILHT